MCSVEDLSLDQQMLIRGYAVIPNFLSEEQINLAIESYRAKAQQTSTVKKILACDPDFIKDTLGANIEDAMQRVRSDDYHPDTFKKGVFFSTERGVNIAWHQEHTYWWYQTHHHYLHVYVPIIKPDVTKGNLSIVPVDNWMAKDPELWKKIEWGGCRRLVPDSANPGHLKMMDDWQDCAVASIPYRLEDISATPHLRAGDALLFRGDLFHQTQDTETNRVALSVRAWCNSCPVTLEHLERSLASSKFSQAAHKSYDWAAMEEVLRKHDKKQQQHLELTGEKLPMLTFGEAREQIEEVQKRQLEEKAAGSTGIACFDCAIC